MNTKKLWATGIMAVSILLVPAYMSAEGNAPESIAFEEDAHLLAALGETYDAAQILEITGEGASQEILYSTYDESVAEVSADGIITAVGYGVTTIVASSVADEAVSASMDVAVYDLYGTYSGVKTIEAMGCDISIDITLNDDGTFDYYRAPMVVQLEGGGEMPELEGDGTFEMDGTQITFTSETLGEFAMAFSLEDEDGCLTGKVPTGGADTEMELIKEAEEESTEEETAQEAAEEESEA